MGILISGVVGFILGFLAASELGAVRLTKELEEKLNLYERDFEE